MSIKHLMKQAEEMQAKIAATQERLANEESTGTAGGGLVSVTLTGAFALKKLTIDPSLVDPQDTGLLEDAIKAAFNDAAQQIHHKKNAPMSDVAGGMNPPAGMKLPF